MAEFSLTTQWSDFVDGKQRIFLRHSRSCSPRGEIQSPRPLDKSLTEIGPDFGEGGAKWSCGVRANTGDIYCAPYLSNRILKIHTNDGTVETLDDVELPETSGY